MDLQSNFKVYAESTEHNQTTHCSMAFLKEYKAWTATSTVTSTPTCALLPALAITQTKKRGRIIPT